MLQQDPAGVYAGLNLYQYAGGNPATYTDAFGLQPDTLRYNGSTLTLYADDGTVKWSGSATSGRPGATAADQASTDFGPIPEGTYSIDPAQISTTPSLFRYFARQVTGDWGAHRVPAEPVGANPFGRTGFKIHGGMTPGSAGCIDVGLGEYTLFPLLEAHKGKIPLVVNYPSPSTRTVPEESLRWIK